MPTTSKRLELPDWTPAIKAYGESRDWKPLARTGAFREFWQTTNTPVHAKHPMAGISFYAAYQTLAEMSAAERDAVTSWEVLRPLGMPIFRELRKGMVEALRSHRKSVRRKARELKELVQAEPNPIKRRLLARSLSKQNS